MSKMQSNAPSHPNWLQVQAWRDLVDPHTPPNPSRTPSPAIALPTAAPYVTAIPRIDGTAPPSDLNFQQVYSAVQSESCEDFDDYSVCCTSFSRWLNLIFFTQMARVKHIQPSRMT
jgi:hypothetical protein